MAAHKALPFLGFSGQEYWSGFPFPSPMHENEKWKWSSSVVSYSQRPHGLQATRLLRPWNFPDKSTGVGCHCLLWNSPGQNTGVGRLSLSSGSSQPRNWTGVFWIIGGFFTGWAIREASSPGLNLSPLPCFILPLTLHIFTVCFPPQGECKLHETRHFAHLSSAYPGCLEHCLTLTRFSKSIFWNEWMKAYEN